MLRGARICRAWSLQKRAKPAVEKATGVGPQPPVYSSAVRIRAEARA